MIALQLAAQYWWASLILLILAWIGMGREARARGRKAIGVIANASPFDRQAFNRSFEEAVELATPNVFGRLCRVAFWLALVFLIVGIVFLLFG